MLDLNISTAVLLIALATKTHGPLSKGCYNGYHRATVLVSRRAPARVAYRLVGLSGRGSEKLWSFAFCLDLASDGHTRIIYLRAENSWPKIL